MKKPALTAAVFDRIAERDGTATSRDRIIWTLPAIGQRIGVGGDFVRDVIAKEPGNPIREIGGKYYVFECDLISFLREPRETVSNPL